LGAPLGKIYVDIPSRQPSELPDSQSGFSGQGFKLNAPDPYAHHIRPNRKLRVTASRPHARDADSTGPNRIA
jgi:hypothetical protein